MTLKLKNIYFLIFLGIIKNCGIRNTSTKKFNSKICCIQLNSRTNINFFREFDVFEIENSSLKEMQKDYSEIFSTITCPHKFKYLS